VAVTAPKIWGSCAPPRTPLNKMAFTSPVWSPIKFPIDQCIKAHQTGVLSQCRGAAILPVSGQNRHCACCERAWVWKVRNNKHFKQSCSCHYARHVSPDISEGALHVRPDRSEVWWSKRRLHSATSSSIADGVHPSLLLLLLLLPWSSKTDMSYKFRHRKPDK